MVPILPRLPPERQVGGLSIAGASVKTYVKKVSEVAKKTSSRKTAAGRKKKAKTSLSASKTKGGAKKTPKKAAKKVARKSNKKAPAAANRAERTKKKLKVKTPLSKKELKEFREVLLEKRRSLIGDMGSIEAEALRRNRKESSGDLSSMPTHPADLGTDNYEYEFSLGLLESERALLGEINEAIERIGNHTYGICLGTGQPIGKARLHAKPWSKYCIEYARMIEKGLVHPGENNHELEEQLDQKDKELDEEDLEE